MFPDWINYVTMTDSYETTLNPCKCDRCKFEWYPRINRYGEIKLNICPKCKSKLWNEPKI